MRDLIYGRQKRSGWQSGIRGFCNAAFKPTKEVTTESEVRPQSVISIWEGGRKSQSQVISLSTSPCNVLLSEGRTM